MAHYHKHMAHYHKHMAHYHKYMADYKLHPIGAANRPSKSSLTVIDRGGLYGDKSNCIRNRVKQPTAESHNDMDQMSESAELNLKIINVFSLGGFQQNSSETREIGEAFTGNHGYINGEMSIENTVESNPSENISGSLKKSEDNKSSMNMNFCQDGFRETHRKQVTKELKMITTPIPLSGRLHGIKTPLDRQVRVGEQGQNISGKRAMHPGSELSANTSNTQDIRDRTYDEGARTAKVLRLGGSQKQTSEKLEGGGNIPEYPEEAKVLHSVDCGVRRENTKIVENKAMREILVQEMSGKSQSKFMSGLIDQEKPRLKIPENIFQIPQTLDDRKPQFIQTPSNFNHITYRCKYCYVIHTDKEAAISHSKTCRLTCNMCGKVFPTVEQLEYHLMDNETCTNLPMKHYDCASCAAEGRSNLRFLTTEALEVHLKIAHPEPPKLSQPSILKTGNGLSKGNNDAAPVMRQPCMLCSNGQCGSKYFTDDELKLHFERYHQKEPKPKKRKYIFEGPSNKPEPTAMKLPESQADKVAPSVYPRKIYALKGSPGMMDEDKEYSYTVLTKPMLSNQGLGSKDVTVYSCTFCPWHFDREDHLLQHEAMFHPKCYIGKSEIRFPDCKSLEAYHREKEAQRESDFQFICNICLKKFKYASRLKAHMDEYSWASNPSVYMCSINDCGKRFHIKKALNWHVEKEHPRKKCIICGQGLKWYAGLENHMKHCHGMTRMIMKKVKKQEDVGE